MRTLIVIIVLGLVIVDAHAQYYLEYMRSNPDANFYEIETAVEAYYEGKDKGRGSGYKQYKRWAIQTEPYVYPSGELVNYQAKVWQEHLKYDKQITSAQRSTHGNWTAEGPDHYVDGWGYNGGNGRVNCIAIHPTNSQVIFVGTPAGGLWKSTNGGNSWIPLTDGLPTLGVSGVAINPQNTNEIFMLTGDGDGNNMPSIGVLKSTDGGASWNMTGLNWTINWNYPTTIRAYKLLMHPTNPDILFVAANNGIWRTGDGGQNWTPVWSFHTWDIEFHPTNASVMYATGGNFFRSENGGLTWGVDGDPDFPGSYDRISVDVSPAAPNDVFLLFGGNQLGNGTFSGFYRSNDQGLDFDLQSNTPNILGYVQNGQDDDHQAGYDLALVVDPSDADVLYTGGINVYKSENGGVDWQIMSWWKEDGNSIGYTHADIHALEIFNGTLYCGSDGGIFSSIDDGENWTNHSHGLAIMQFYAIDVSSNVITGGTQDNGCNQWVSGGSTATHSIGADGFECIIDYSNPNIRYQSDQNAKYRSTNGGVSFTQIGPGVSNYWNSDWVMDPVTPSTLFLAQQNIWRTTNGGTGWANMNAGFTNGNNIGSLAQGFLQPRMLYASDQESIRRTTGAYASFPAWTDISSGLPVAQSMISGIAVDPLDSNRLWVSFYGVNAGQKVYFSPNGGGSWFNESGSLPNVPVNCIKVGSIFGDELYIGTDIGVFYRNDAIGDWIFFGNGMPNTRVLDLDVEWPKIYAGTFGRGIWSSDVYSICPNQLVLTQQNDPSNSLSTGIQEYHAANNITSSRVIVGGLGTNVSYHAGTDVILTDGFWVKDNSVFTVDLSGCPE